MRGISRGRAHHPDGQAQPGFFSPSCFALFKVGGCSRGGRSGYGACPRMLNCLRESRARALIGIPPAHVLRTLAP